MLRIYLSAEILSPWMLGAYRQPCGGKALYPLPGGRGRSRRHLLSGSADAQVAPSRPITRLTLWPPKPKLLLMAWSTFRSRAVLGT